MRRFLCATTALMVLLTACSGPGATETEPTAYEHIPYVSTITAEECFICGDTQSSLHWGEENVGILNLNTFEILRIEINR